MRQDTTLVGVFDDVDLAEKAAQRLESAGIAPEAMRIERNTIADDRGRGQPRREVGREGGTLRSFFVELFGIGAGESDDEADYPGHYAEAVRRGSSVLVVHTATDQQMEIVVDVLDDCGAIDIDERVEQWRLTGYTRHDEQAGPYLATGAAPSAARAADLTAATTAAPSVAAADRDSTSATRGVASRVRVHRRFGATPVARNVDAEVENATAADAVSQRPGRSGERRGSVGTSGSGPRVRIGYEGPERRSATPAAYTGIERRVAME